MNRRQLCIGALAGVVMPRQVKACDVELIGTPTPQQPIETVATFFRWVDESGLRTLAIRARIWSEMTDAVREQRTIMYRVGPSTSEEKGEVYSSDKISFGGRDLGDGIEEDLVGWQKIEGVAAYETGTVVLTVRRWSTLWDASITAGSLDLAALWARNVSDLVLTLEPSCGTIATYLPTVDDLPPGATEEPYPFGSNAI